jgi:hypothetical protein
MTNAPSMNAQHQGSTIPPQRREWKKPVLDILALANAQHGRSSTHDGFSKHKSG